jgi:large subunit ribosomal protein MRP49
MIVNRHGDNSIPPTMTIYVRDGDSNTAGSQGNATHLSSAWDGSAKAPLPADGERTVTIEMRNQHSSVILKEFMDKTGAVPILPTPQEQAEMDDIKELKQRAEIDRAEQAKFNAAKKREEALMAQARSEAAAFKAAAA